MPTLVPSRKNKKIKIKKISCVFAVLWYSNTMNYNEPKFYTAKVKNLTTSKTKFFDVFAPSIAKAALAAEELGSLFFCTASVECIACGLNRLGAPNKDEKIS